MRPKLIGLIIILAVAALSTQTQDRQMPSGTKPGNDRSPNKGNTNDNGNREEQKEKDANMRKEKDNEDDKKEEDQHEDDNEEGSDTSNNERNTDRTDDGKEKKDAKTLLGSNNNRNENNERSDNKPNTDRKAEGEERENEKDESGSRNNQNGNEKRSDDVNGNTDGKDKNGHEPKDTRRTWSGSKDTNNNKEAQEEKSGEKQTGHHKDTNKPSPNNEHKPQDTDDDKKACPLESSPKCRAFDDSTDKMTFHADFFRYLKNLKETKKAKFEKLYKFVEEFENKLGKKERGVWIDLKMFDKLASCKNMKTLFLDYTPEGDTGLIKSILSLLWQARQTVSNVGKKSSRPSKEMLLKSTLFLSVFSKEIINKVMETEENRKMMCTYFMAIRLGCRHTNFSLEAIIHKKKSCLDFKETNLEAAVLSLTVKHGQPEKWKASAWEEFFSWPQENKKLYPVFVSNRKWSTLLLKSMEKFLHMSTHIQEICPLMKEHRKKDIVDHLRKYAKHKKSQNKENMKDIINIIKKCDGSLKGILTCKEEMKMFKRGDAKHIPPKRRAECAKEIFDDCKKVTSKEIARYFPILTRKQFKCFTAKVLKDTICILNDEDRASRAISDLYYTLKKKKIMSTLTTTGNQIPCWWNLLHKLKENEVKSIKNSVIKKSLNAGKLKNIRFSCKIAKVIKEKYESQPETHSNNRSLSSSQLLNYGNMLRCFKKTDWKKIDSDSLTNEVIQEFANALKRTQKYNRYKQDFDKFAVEKFVTKAMQRKDKDKVIRILFEYGIYDFAPLTAKEKGELLADIVKNQDLKVDYMEKYIKIRSDEVKGIWKSFKKVIGNEDDNFLSIMNDLENNKIWAGMSTTETKLKQDEDWLCEKDPKFYRSRCMKNKQYNSIKRVCKSENSCNSIQFDEDEDDNSATLSVMSLFHRKMCNGWGPDVLKDAGYILQGITTEDIPMLQLTLDVITKLGEYDGWSEPQKLEMFKRFLRFSKDTTDVKVLTDEELKLLGHFTCGMTTDQIASIDHSTYKNAASEIGQVTSCNGEQLKQWAQLAKKAYGDVSNWDMATLEKVGAVIGGLDQNDIKKLDGDQIDSIHPRHIGYFPPSTLQGFTAKQLGLFSSLQIQAITPAQLSVMSDEQIKALEVLVGEISDAPSHNNKRLGGSFDNGNGCDSVSLDWKTVVVMVISGMVLLIT